MTNCKDIHSRYVLRAMEDHCLNGDAYVAEDVLYHRCKERQRGLSYATFKADLAEQINRRRCRSGSIRFGVGCPRSDGL